MAYTFRCRPGRRAGTHTPQSIDGARRMGPRFREDDIERVMRSTAMKRRSTAMKRTSPNPLAALSLAALMSGTSGLCAADVTYERLLNPEPQNWLMNHHDYGSQRFSALATINKSNVKNLKLAFAVPLGGSSGNEYVEATPLVDDGMMYLTDVWGVVYKIDVRSGSAGRILWKMDPGQQKADRNRGVALWGNLVISVAGYDARVIATDKESGQVVWDRKLGDQPDLPLTAAPLALEDSILIGASGADNDVLH